MKIVRSDRDYYGNSKENIFFAVENDEIIGRGFVYPNYNKQISQLRPLNIYMDMFCMREDNHREIYENLMGSLKDRACEIAGESPEHRAWLYSGSSEQGDSKLKFLVDEGFNIEAYTHIMECSVEDINNLKANDHVEIVHMDIENEKNREEFVNIHNSIFIELVSEEFFKEMRSEIDPMYICVYHDGRIIGSLVSYMIDREENEKIGFIEKLFVVDEFKGKGIAKALMKKAGERFRDKGVEIAELIVWSENRRAVDFYRSIGFKVKDHKEYYRGIEL